MQRRRESDYNISLNSAIASHSAALASCFNPRASASLIFDILLVRSHG